VANPGEIMVFKRKSKRNKYEVKPLDMEILAEAYAQGDSTEGLMSCVEDVVDKYFKEVDPSKGLDVVFSKSLSEMCRRLVDYDDDNAATEILKLVYFYFYRSSFTPYFQCLIDTTPIWPANIC
jgi:double-strand break repair protein MRE11